MIRFFCIVLFLFLCEEYFAEKFRQEGAVIKYCNPRYIIKCTALTRRPNRRQPYKTNSSSTTLVPFGNNVTLQLTYGLKEHKEMFSVKYKFCDISKNKWLMDYFKAYAHIDNLCPLPPGSYSVYNMELPPKNFPLPIPKGDVFIKIVLFKTADLELIAEMLLVVHET